MELSKTLKTRNIGLLLIPAGVGIRGTIPDTHKYPLANRCRAKSLKKIRKILTAPPPEKPVDAGEETHSFPCPKCKKGRLIFKGQIDPEISFGHLVPS